MSLRKTLVFGDQLDETIFGAGLVRNDTDDFAHALDVNVDDATVEVTLSNIVQVKDSGITEAKLDMFNTPTVGYILGYTSNGMEWVVPADVDSYIANEVPSGLINSLNTDYTLANTPIVGTVMVYLNGLLQFPGSGGDYTISGTTISFVKAPHTASEVLVSYFID